MAQDSIDIDELLRNVPIDDIAAKFGVDKATATSAVKQALPGLLGGLAVNSQNAAGASNLESALKKHEGADLSAGLVGIDQEDGKKIVKHVLGDDETSVAKTLSANAGGGIGDLIPKLLPILAPIVMTYLANKVFGGTASSGESTASSTSSSGGIGDLLGGLLGGGSTGSASSAGGIGDLLGGLLGGGSSNTSSGGLGGLLGGLLGGK